MNCINLISALKLMCQGMVGIFAVMTFILIAVWVMLKILR